MAEFKLLDAFRCSERNREYEPDSITVIFSIAYPSFNLIFSKIFESMLVCNSHGQLGSQPNTLAVWEMTRDRPERFNKTSKHSWIPLWKSFPTYWVLLGLIFTEKWKIEILTRNTWAGCQRPCQRHFVLRVASVALHYPKNHRHLRDRKKTWIDMAISLYETQLCSNAPRQCVQAHFHFTLLQQRRIDIIAIMISCCWALLCAHDAVCWLKEHERESHSNEHLPLWVLCATRPSAGTSSTTACEVFLLHITANYAQLRSRCRSRFRCEKSRVDAPRV